jgi:hypothetical protein
MFQIIANDDYSNQIEKFHTVQKLGTGGVKGHGAICGRSGRGNDDKRGYTADEARSVWREGDRRKAAN